MLLLFQGDKSKKEQSCYLHGDRWLGMVIRGIELG
jgi:hypothetical protein